MRLAAVPALLLAGCAPHVQADPALDPAWQQMLAKGCGADVVQDMVGTVRSDAAEAEVRRRSGATAIRWIAPGEVVTMDYRRDRLDVRVGPDGKIAGVSCG